MTTSRIPTVLSVLAIALGITASAAGQNYQPFGPVDLSRHDLKIFSPANLGEFGQLAPPKQGVFFRYERLHWYINAPKRTTLGAGPRNIDRRELSFVQTSSIDTAVPLSQAAWGNRWDLGYLMEDDTGWFVSVLDGPRQEQTEQFGVDPFNSNDVSVVFDDPLGLLTGFSDFNGDGFDDDIDGDGIFGRDGVDTDGDGEPNEVDGIARDDDDLQDIPTFFDWLFVRNTTEINSVELNFEKRFKPFHKGAVMSVFFGPRYMEFDDRFFFEGKRGALGDTVASTRAENNLVGPQIGSRIFYNNKRWTLDFEGRFFAAANITNVRQNGSFGSMLPSLSDNAVDTPVDLSPTNFRNSSRDETFSPITEFRANATFHVTKSMAFTVGWTGTFLGQMARGSELIVYEVPRMGIADTDWADTFSHGVNFGVNINR